MDTVNSNKNVTNRERIGMIVFLSVALGLTIFRLAISDVMMIRFMPGSGYDDIMQIVKSITIANGEWLSGYGSMTLVKGVGYPLLTALFHFLHIPYIFAYHLLYIVACIVFMLAIKPLIPNRWVALGIYVFLIFNPIAFSAELTRLYRDIGYYSIAFFSFATSLGMVLHYKERKKSIAFGAAAGLSLAFAISYREDAQWLIIYAVACLVVYLISVFRSKDEGKKRRFLSVLSVPVSFALCFLHICRFHLRCQLPPLRLFCDG